MRGEEGTHTAGADGKCTVCGYQTVSSLAEFTEKYAETAQKFARGAVVGFDATAASSEFVWFKMENDRVTGLTYLYTAAREEGKTPDHAIFHASNSSLGNVWLDEIANGIASHNGVLQSSNTLPAYDKAGQADKKELAEKIVSVCVEKLSKTVDYTPLLRLCSATYSSSGIRLTAIDFFETGYAYYTVKNIAGTEADLADNAVLLGKLQEVAAENCAANVRGDLGTLVYRNIQD